MVVGKSAWSDLSLSDLMLHHKLHPVSRLVRRTQEV